MKKPLLPVILIALLAALLFGCAEKVVWKSLFDTPVPGRTPSLATHGSIVEDDDGDEQESDELFQNDVASMENPRVVVTKSTHTLEVWDGETLMARMRIAYGRGEAGPKRKKGDNRTPEGGYYVCKTSENGKYYKSLFISYPNNDDANAGVADDIIDQETCDGISEDIANRKQPPWDTGLGGEIAICGTGTLGRDKTGDWTAGNIVVSDKNMDYLWDHIKIGAEVEINP